MNDAYDLSRLSPPVPPVPPLPAGIGARRTFLEAEMDRTLMQMAMESPPRRSIFARAVRRLLRPMHRRRHSKELSTLLGGAAALFGGLGTLFGDPDEPPLWERGK